MSFEHRITWEYKVSGWSAKDDGPTLEALMNVHGLAGWEIVSVGVIPGDGVVFYSKRPLADYRGVKYSYAG